MKTEEEKQIERYCAAFGKWWSRFIYDGSYLGYPKKNFIWDLMHSAINFDKHKGKREITYSTIPKEFEDIYIVKEIMRKTSPKEHDVFMEHWSVFSYGKKRANLRMKYDHLGLTKYKYDLYLDRAMTRIKYHLIELPVHENELLKDPVHRALREEFSKL